MKLTDPSGLLLIDKPAGITSFDIIRALRRQTGVRKIGHAGTLDPMATGLMIMLVGSATKQASQYSKQDKTYVAEMTLGATSTTGDAEGDLKPVSDHAPTDQEISEALTKFEGEITQTPSQFSAIKVKGREAYKYARAGQAVDVPSRQVTVYDIKLGEYAYPLVKFEATVSSGTYVRTLAEDIGSYLKTGAFLSALRRTRIGDFDLSQAHQLADVTADILPDNLLTI